MVVEARETIFGIPYKKPEKLTKGSIETFGVLAFDVMPDLPAKGLTVDSSNQVTVVDLLHRKEIKLVKDEINTANLGERNWLIHRRTIHWRPDPVGMLK